MRKDIMDLSGGMNSQVSPLFIRDNQCEIVQNYHMDKLGSLKKRDGIVYLVGQVVDAKSILGMYFFKDVQSTKTNVLVAINDASDTNSDIFDIESNAWAISKADDTAGALPVFCTFVNYVFRTNGSEVMGSSTDPPAAWGTTNCLATLKPKYCAVWEDRVYAANENTGGALKPSRLYWSSLPSAAGALTWTSATDYADINPDDNDEITWIEPFGNRLLVFKNKGLYRWTFGQVEPDKIIDQGTPQGRTVKQTAGICFFANEYGVWAYQSGQPKLISRKVKPWTDAISTLANMRAEVDDDHYYLYIGDVTVDSTAYTNVMLVYTISLDAWHIETYPFEIKAMTRFQSATLGSTAIADAIYLGDDDGYVYRKGTGTVDYLGTTAKPINGYILGKELPTNFPKTSKLREMYVVAQKAAGAQVNYRIDRGEWKSWYDLKERITENPISGRARTFQISITDNSQTQSQVEGYSVEFRTDEETRHETETRRRQN